MFVDNFRKKALENSNFRKVLYTGKRSQLVVMSLKTGEDIGEEVHDDTDQIFIFIDGKGLATVGDETINFDDETAVFVPSGTSHNFKNTGNGDLKFLTIYSPPHHPIGTVHMTKEDALKGGENYALSQM